MKWSGVIRWRTVGLLLAVLVIVGLPYAVTQSNSRTTQVAIAWVNHSTAVKSRTYRIAYIVQDSETAIYRMLTGDANAQTRERIERAARETPQLLKDLRSMTRDNPDQQVQVGVLESNVNGRLALLSQAVTRLQAHDLAGARQSLRDAEDLFAIDGPTATIVANEESLLRERQSVADAQAFNGRLVLTLSALAQLILLGIIVIASENQIGRRLLAETREGRAVLRAQMILQAVREPIGLFDGNLRALLVNAAFSELYGLDGDTQVQELAAMGNGAWSDSALLQRLRDVLTRDRELWDYDLTQRTADGVTRRVVINASRLEQAGGTPALLLTVSDVTARAMVEQEINELNRQLQGKVAQISDVNRELEAFSYSVSHDLRAPLRHISGFSQKLAQHLGDDIDDKARHYIEVVSTAAQRMARLIDDLLVFSRLGRGALRLQAVDMQSLVEEACALAGAEVPERRIVWKLGNLPMVIGDENMLRTVWQNLISNAVKYTGQREVAQIEVSATQAAASGDYEFTVADNGAGFDMQYADKLFGVFQRLHRASEFPGNGIGLANVRRIIARHGGRVWAEAEPDNGARFHFSLPATELAGAAGKGKS